MPYVSVEEWQLLSCLEVEPHLLDPDVPWIYNDAHYCVRQGDVTLNFSLAPSYRDVRIILERGEQRLYELNSLGVIDVTYHRDDDGERIKIIIAENNVIELRVKPQILLQHRVGC